MNRNVETQACTQGIGVPFIKRCRWVRSRLFYPWRLPAPELKSFTKIIQAHRRMSPCIASFFLSNKSLSEDSSGSAALLRGATHDRPNWRAFRYRLNVYVAILCGATFAPSASYADKPRAVAASVIAAEARIPCNGNLPVVDVNTLGNKLRFVIDTGAPRSIYDSKWRSHLGSVKRIVSAVGPDGDDVEIDIFDGPLMRIAGMDIQVDMTTVLDMRDVYPCESKIDGSLGMDALKDLVMRIDSDRGVLQLCREVPPDPGEQFQIQFAESNVPLLRVSIAGAAPVTCAIRTGINAPVCVTHRLFTTLYRRGDLREINPTLSESDLLSADYEGLVSRVALGSFMHEQVEVHSRSAHMIGMGYLSRYTVTLDFPGRRAFFKPGRDFGRRDQINQTGLDLTAQNGLIAVRDVRPNSPAGAAGILGGDVIVQIDNATTDGLSIFDVNRLQASLNEISLRIRRDAKQLTMKLSLQRTDNAAIATGEPPSISHTKRLPRVLCEVAVPRHGDQIVIPMHVSGIDKRLLMLVDTGAAMTLLETAYETKLGPAVGRTAIRLTSGESSVHCRRFADARISNMTLTEEGVAGTMDLAQIRDASGYDIDGILGVDFLQRFVVQFDFDAGKLRFLSAVPADSGTKLQMHYTPDGLPAVLAFVGNDTSAWFIIDTGCQGFNRCQDSTFSEAVGRGAIHRVQRQDGIGPALRSADGQLNARVGFADRLTVGPFEHEMTVIGSGSFNVLGLDYLSRYLVTVDFPGAAIYLKRGWRFDRYELADTCGLQIIRKASRYVVTVAAPGSPAEAAGLNVNDVIYSIDRANARDLSLFEVRELLSQDGGAAVIVALRGERTIETTLKFAKRSRNRRDKADSGRPVRESRTKDDE